MRAVPATPLPSPQMSLALRLKAKAQELGFDLVGITGAEPSAFAVEYRAWLAQGYAGEMEYLTRNLDRRLNPCELLPNARSIIVVGMNYDTDAPRSPDHESHSTDHDLRTTNHEPSSTAHAPQTTNHACETGVFARYARGDDYHEVMTARLRRLLDFLKGEAGGEADGRVYVDAGPILEREVARRAGLGWFGKNTLLINTRRGSYFFLGEIVTNVALPADAPAVGGCGTCTRCLDACPTGAILEPYLLDARRCLSYLTIELKGAIPEEFRPALAESGNRIYGCDICQECCPFCQRRSTPTTEPAFQSRDITTNAKLTDLLYLTEEAFREKFTKSPVKRAKRRGLLRNAAYALCNRDDEEAIAALKHALNDPEELVRDAAAWSLEKINERT